MIFKQFLNGRLGVVLSLVLAAAALSGCTVKIYENPKPTYHYRATRVYYVPGHYAAR